MRRHVIFNMLPQPVPLLAFRAGDLDAATTNVTSWRNAGLLGAGYNLAPEAGNSAPTYFATGGDMDRPYVRFTGNDILRTLSELPATVAGQRPRALLARVYVEPGANPGAFYNLFGYGKFGSESAGTNGQGGAFDFSIYSNDNYTLAKFYAGLESNMPVTRGKWVWCGMVIGLPNVAYANPDASANNYKPTYSQYIFFGDTESPRQNKVYEGTDPSVFRLGGGAYTPWNQPGLGLLVDSFYLYELLTSAELAQAMS